MWRRWSPILTQRLKQMRLSDLSFRARFYALLKRTCIRIRLFWF